MSQQRGSFVPAAVCLFVVLAFAGAASGRAAATPAPCKTTNPPDPTLIEITAGKTKTPVVCGKVAASPTVYTYQGIPYAQPPLKEQRWQPPTKATWPPAAAVQRVAFGQKCLQPYITYAGGADCLHLNIWTPKGAINGKKKLPVMVFIHGGAFEVGSGSSPIFEGSTLANSGVVVVTLNYRLGALGFLVANGHASGQIKGNMGLLDQQMAMQWVVDNIAPFGGDPTRITLFGESAGAISVGLHTLVVPSSQKLFAAALMESNPLGVTYLSSDQAQSAGNSFLDGLCDQYNKDNWAGLYPKCPTKPTDKQDPSWLGIVSAYTIMKIQKQHSQTASAFSPSLPWAPVVDGTLVTAEPYAGYASGVTTRKPLAFGVNANEGVLFAALDYQQDPSFFDGSTQYKAALQTPPLNATIAAKILAIDRYNPDKQTDPAGSYYNATGVAFANLMTDYVFACGNLAVANAAAEAGSAPVYGYQFTQAPFYDLYDLKHYPVDDGACMPVTKNVCHGNELPYVFGNLGAVTTTSDPVFTPTAGDKSLATKMAAAWAAFAINPAAPGSGWLRYTSGGTVQQWNSASGQPVNLDKQANCSKLWLGTPPYKKQ